MIYIGFKKCSVCGGSVAEVMDSNGDLYCADCADGYLVKCDVCGSLVHIDSLEETHDGELICVSCIRSVKYKKCTDCGEWISPDDQVEIHNGDIICPSCYDDYYFTCENCDEIHHVDDMVMGPRDECLCDVCYDDRVGVCDYCNEPEYVDKLTYVSGYGHVCDACIEDHFYCCDNCGEWVHSDDIVEVDGEYFCGDCAEDANYGEYIHDYMYKPIPNFYGDSDKHRFYGIELEVDNGSGVPEEILTDEIYLKHDGSLDRGFEIVSHPMSYDYIINDMNWGEMFKTLKSYGYRSHDVDTCGLHIHISLDAFGRTEQRQDYNIHRLILFFENNWDEILKFSRRNQHQVDRWANRYGIDEIPTCKKEAATKNRYRAINCCNEHTIEIRIFRGTLKLDTFVATIQFMECLMNFILNPRRKIIVKDSWKIFVNSIPDDMEELKNYITERVGGDD